MVEVNHFDWLPAVGWFINGGLLGSEVPLHDEAGVQVREPCLVWRYSWSRMIALELAEG